MCYLAAPLSDANIAFGDASAPCDSKAGTGTRVLGKSNFSTCTLPFIHSKSGISARLFSNSVALTSNLSLAYFPLRRPVILRHASSFLTFAKSNPTAAIAAAAVTTTSGVD
eukprot:CAMPEP_0203841976 /NCGR_PEP_ID=MMETSP0359-20131031/1714_1 /ASSEMBLY_ACC=CAM_ASM_000338 /TAXON_ID=268821 /ORGANISM="Scrippsiella Hangoei, Strain SHTV-5" /LENGTH=110 /DNA_ID=CAMNT_0050756485 /DNA_START=83 /DNA_END=415 /DNA_ORIENTATION=+